MATKTVANIVNSDLRRNAPNLPHRLDYMSEAIVREEPPTLQMALSGLTRDPYLRWANAKPAAYIDVFVDHFLGLSQVYARWWSHIRQTLFCPLNKVL